MPDMEAICEVLGATEGGLTGSEIGELRHRIGVPYPGPTVTKRQRIFEALRVRQERNNAGNIVGMFIEEAMVPVRYAARAQVFGSRAPASTSA